jgi:hypothetical protein
MEPIETFARSAPPPGVSRRRVLKVLAATAVAAQFTGLSDGVLTSANAAVAAWQPPPSYDRIVGLL